MSDDIMLKVGDVLQEGDEFKHNGKMHKVFPEGVGTTVNGVGVYYRPIVEACDHIVGVLAAEMGGVSEIRKSHGFEYHDYIELWCKHCPDCGKKL